MLTRHVRVLDVRQITLTRRAFDCACRAATCRAALCRLLLLFLILLQSCLSFCLSLGGAPLRRRRTHLHSNFLLRRSFLFFIHWHPDAITGAIPTC
jgi:hypothetical protein